MHVPESVLNEAVVLLNKDEDEVLQSLGVELYSLERQQPVYVLAPTIPARDLRQKSIDYIEKKRTALRESICPAWREKSREDFVDTTRTLAFLISLLGEILKLPLSYIAIPMHIAVIITKRGIDSFCK